MKIKALVSFSGRLSMAKGEIGEYSDKTVLSDLLSAGYIEEVKETAEAPKRKRGVKADESK